MTSLTTIHSTSSYAFKSGNALGKASENPLSVATRHRVAVPPVKSKSTNKTSPLMPKQFWTNSISESENSDADDMMTTTQNSHGDHEWSTAPNSPLTLTDTALTGLRTSLFADAVNARLSCAVETDKSDVSSGTSDGDCEVCVDPFSGRSVSCVHRHLGTPATTTATTMATTLPASSHVVSHMELDVISTNQLDD
jgi:hypothetical protein